MDGTPGLRGGGVENPDGLLNALEAAGRAGELRKISRRIAGSTSLRDQQQIINAAADLDEQRATIARLEAELADAETPKRQAQRMLAQIIEDGTLSEGGDWVEAIPAKLREIAALQERVRELEGDHNDLVNVISGRGDVIVSLRADLAREREERERLRAICYDIGHGDWDEVGPDEEGRAYCEVPKNLVKQAAQTPLPDRATHGLLAERDAAIARAEKAEADRDIHRKKWQRIVETQLRPLQRGAAELEAENEKLRELRGEVEKFAGRCERWFTPDDLGAQFANGRMGAFRDCAGWLRAALAEADAATKGAE